MLSISMAFRFVWNFFENVYYTVTAVEGLTAEHVVFVTVGAVLEHEAIAGLSGIKPTGLRGRALSTSQDPDSRKEQSLTTLLKAVSYLGPNVVLLLRYRRRQWANIKTTLII